MDISIIESAKLHEDKDEVIELFNEAILSLTGEFNTIMTLMRKIDKKFVIEIQELQIKTLTEDLALITDYLEHKYAIHFNLKEDAAIELHQLLKSHLPPKKITMEI